MVYTGFVAVSGATAMLPETTTIDEPAIRMYASPQALNPVPGSIPQTGRVAASVATARGFQSLGKVGNVSCTEQP